MKKNSIFRWGVAMLLLFTGLSLRAYAEDDGGSPFRKNHDVDLTVKSATLQTFTDAFTKQTGVLFLLRIGAGVHADGRRVGTREQRPRWSGF